MHNFKKLKVYERAIEFATRVYQLTERFPSHELYGLVSQLRRAACSIALNIAEGSGNPGGREFARFLDYSIRSGYECIACFEIAKRVGYIDEGACSAIILEVEEIISMLVGLKRTVRVSRVPP